MQNVGETRAALVEAHWKEIESLLDANQWAEKPYFILVAALNDPSMDGVIRQIYRCSFQKPKPMLCTMCYYVDNKKGEVKELWALPRDVPEAAFILDQSEDINPAVLNSVQRLSGYLQRNGVAKAPLL